MRSNIPEQLEQEITRLLELDPMDEYRFALKKIKRFERMGYATQEIELEYWGKISDYYKGLKT